MAASPRSISSAAVRGSAASTLPAASNTGCQRLDWARLCTSAEISDATRRAACGLWRRIAGHVRERRKSVACTRRSATPRSSGPLRARRLTLAIDSGFTRGKRAATRGWVYRRDDVVVLGRQGSRLAVQRHDGWAYDRCRTRRSRARIYRGAVRDRLRGLRRCAGVQSEWSGRGGTQRSINAPDRRSSWAREGGDCGAGHADDRPRLPWQLVRWFVEGAPSDATGCCGRSWHRPATGCCSRRIPTRLFRFDLLSRSPRGRGVAARRAVVRAVTPVSPRRSAQRRPHWRRRLGSRDRRRTGFGDRHHLCDDADSVRSRCVLRSWRRPERSSHGSRQ